MHDVDFTLLPSLLEGVRTGFSAAIPPSGIFPPKESSEVDLEPKRNHPLIAQMIKPAESGAPPPSGGSAQGSVRKVTDLRKPLGQRPGRRP